MKHQYVGDINDYLKYGLLRSIAAVGLSVGICWMLTGDDGGSDGGKIAYLRDPHDWAHHDRALFDHLKWIVESPSGRHLRHVQSDQVLPGARFFDELVPVRWAERSEWFVRATRALASVDVVFFDPDNGIEVPSRPMGTKLSPKYVYWVELEESWRMGSSLLVFQHFPRVSHSLFAREKVEELRRRLPSAHVTPIATTSVLFLLAIQGNHKHLLDSALERFRHAWSSRLHGHEHIL